MGTGLGPIPVRRASSNFIRKELFPEPIKLGIDLAALHLTLPPTISRPEVPKAS